MRDDANVGSRCKNTLYEGGVHGVGFVTSPLIKKPNRISHSLIHAVDWFPTFLHLANVTHPNKKPLDGMNVWETISSGKESPRKELLHNVDPVHPRAAIRVGDFKLLTGYPCRGADEECCGWVPAPDTNGTVVEVSAFSCITRTH